MNREGIIINACTETIHGFGVASISPKHCSFNIMSDSRLTYHFLLFWPAMVVFLALSRCYCHLKSPLQRIYCCRNAVLSHDECPQYRREDACPASKEATQYSPSSRGNTEVILASLLMTFMKVKETLLSEKEARGCWSGVNYTSLNPCLSWLCRTEQRI